MRSGEKRVDNASLNLQVGVRSGVACPNAPTCAAGKLPGRLGGALDDWRDLLEGYVEDVMQHERNAFGRPEGLKHHE
jgi:hypothetical protein